MTTALATTELRTIRLYGTLARIVGCRTLEAAVSSVAEAMRFLMANFPEVEGHLQGRFFKVKVADWVLEEHELSRPVGHAEDICIIPAICGAGGNGPLTGILAGAALIGIGFLVPFTGSLLIPLGLGLLLTGVAELISPTPKVRDEDNDPSRSYNFSGLQQTSREGVPVPLVYGEIFTGSVTISAEVEEDDEKLEPSFSAGSGNPYADLPPGVPPPPPGPPTGPTGEPITGELAEEKVYVPEDQTSRYFFTFFTFLTIYISTKISCPGTQNDYPPETLGGKTTMQDGAYWVLTDFIARYAVVIRTYTVRQVQLCSSDFPSGNAPVGRLIYVYRWDGTQWTVSSGGTRIVYRSQTVPFIRNTLYNTSFTQSNETSSSVVSFTRTVTPINTELQADGYYKLD